MFTEPHQERFRKRRNARGLGVKRKNYREKKTERKKERKERKKEEKVFYDIVFRNFNYSGEICERDPKRKL